jgi:heat shock protein HtpX
MSKGMPMPKVQVMESPMLNAFASGLDKRTFTVTLTRGIIDTLSDEELEGVIAHELMHIRNKDVRLLVITIIFVGIFAFVVQVAFRSVLYGGLRSRDNKKSDGRAMLIILAVSAVAYLLSIMFKFALSRKREYLADAGAAEMTKNPRALASALGKISGNYKVESIKSSDVEQMFIHNGPSSGFLGGLGGLFSTHPPIDKRIQALENFG